MSSFFPVRSEAYAFQVWGKMNKRRSHFTLPEAAALQDTTVALTRAGAAAAMSSGGGVAGTPVNSGLKLCFPQRAVLRYGSGVKR